MLRINTNTYTQIILRITELAFLVEKEQGEEEAEEVAELLF